MRRIFYIFSFFFHIGFIFANQDYFNIFRDEYSEKFLKDFAAPIFQVVGINGDDYQILLTNQRTIDISMLEDKTILIPVGVFLKTGNSDLLYSLLAHQISHIVLGHKKYYNEEFKKKLITEQISMIKNISDKKYKIKEEDFKFPYYSKLEEEEADKLMIEISERNMRSICGISQIAQEKYNRVNQIIPYYDFFATHPIYLHDIYFDRIEFLIRVGNYDLDSFNKTRKSYALNKNGYYFNFGYQEKKESDLEQRFNIVRAILSGYFHLNQIYFEKQNKNIDIDLLEDPKFIKIINKYYNLFLFLSNKDNFKNMNISQIIEKFEITENDRDLIKRISEFIDSKD